MRTLHFRIVADHEHLHGTVKADEDLDALSQCLEVIAFLRREQQIAPFAKPILMIDFDPDSTYLQNFP